MTGRPLLHYQHSCRSFVDKLREVQADSNIGKSSSEQSPNKYETEPSPFYVRPPTSNSPVPRPLSSTFGRKTHELKAASSSSEREVVKETIPTTGIQFGVMPYWETLQIFPQIYVYAVIINCEELGRITYSRLEFSELSWFTGATLELAKAGSPGMRPVTTLTVNHDSFENSSRLYIVRPNSSQLIVTAYTYIWGNICKVSQYGITPN
ncbi:hypothetical protein MT418_005624 [Batrachochytrium dendrobatidis]